MIQWHKPLANSAKAPTCDDDDGDDVVVVVGGGDVVVVVGGGGDDDSGRDRGCGLRPSPTVHSQSIGWPVQSVPFFAKKKHASGEKRFSRTVASRNVCMAVILASGYEEPGLWSLIIRSYSAPS